MEYRVTTNVKLKIWLNLKKGKKTHLFPTGASPLHYDLTREGYTLVRAVAKAANVVYRAPSLIIYQRQKKKRKKGKKKTDQCEQIVWARNIPKEKKEEKKKKTHAQVRPGRFCIAVSLYPVWADVDAIYQVLKQAGEIRGNSTNSPPTPPTAEHPPSGAAPSSARASSHPCSSSTSGKAHRQEFLPTLERARRHPENFTHVHTQWRITRATYAAGKGRAKKLESQALEFHS